MKDKKPKWYDHKKNLVRQTRDTLIINKTKIIVGTDPRDGFTLKDAKDIDAWINVSDTPCNSLGELPWKTERYWFPVAEVHHWSFNHAYWIAKLLTSLVYDRKDIKKIFIHCHAGARRSPTSLQMWLIYTFGMRNANRIFDYENDQSHWNTQGYYGELVPELELFYNVMKYNKYDSLEGLLLMFNRVTLGKYDEYFGVPERPNKDKKTEEEYYTTREKYIKSFSDQLKQKIKFGEPFKLVNEVTEKYGELYDVNRYIRNNKCGFDLAWLTEFYVNEILKEPKWNYPVIWSKDGTHTKESMEVKELKNHLNYSDTYNKQFKKLVYLKGKSMTVH